MARKMVNVRFDEDLWKQVRLDAVQQDMALQDWLTLAIIRLLNDNRKDPIANREDSITELHIAGEGIKR